jgi:hypothetical protein
MKIETLTHRNVLDLMGSETTDNEATLMLRILKNSGYEDTKDISDTEWLVMLGRAIENAKQI